MPGSQTYGEREYFWHVQFAIGAINHQRSGGIIVARGKKTEAAIKEIAEADKQAAETQIVEQSKKIDFYLTEYTIELLAKKMTAGDFEIPAYQREFTWEDSRRARFIESVLMGLPIPFLFFWEMPSGKLEIVDGVQRLRTIQEFLADRLVLDELESLPTLNGFRFSDLLESRQRKVGNRSIRGIVLNEDADEQARFDMFERINTGSKQANNAEVRRGALAGPFMTLVIQLATRPKFVDLAPVADKLVRERQREELVTRFFAYGDGLDGYRDRPSEFLFKYTKQMNSALVRDPALANAYSDRFDRMLDFVEAAFPFGFKKSKTGKHTPKARFEAISIGSELALRERPELFNAPPQVDHWISGKPFENITGSDGANAIARLRDRIAFVKNRLIEV